MQRKPHIGFLVAVVLATVVAGTGCDKLRARDKLNKGVEAYKGAQFDVAIEDFKQAREYDPSLTSAQLYLATAYASQYVPGAPSPENIRNGQQAITEFKAVLANDPNNLSAIDGIGSVLYNMAGTPFDPEKMDDAKSYQEQHIKLKPDDPEPYYWVGVIDWARAYRANRELREQFNKTSKKPIKEGDPLPPAVAKGFNDMYATIVDDGITNIQKAITLRDDYDDAMAYLNLLYRQKADMEATTEARDADQKMADDLVDKVKAIKQKKANLTPNS